MTHSLYISTTEAGSGKALVSLGIIELLLRRTTKVHFFRPLVQVPDAAALADPDHPGWDEDIDLIVSHFNLKQTYEESFGLKSTQANDLLAERRTDEIIDIIIGKYKTLESRGDFLLCEGSDYLDENSAFEFGFNQEVAKNLGAPILILGSAHHRTIDEVINPVQRAVDAYLNHGCDVVGVIINKADPDQLEPIKEALFQHFGLRGWLLSVLPYNLRLSSPRMRDIAAQLGAEVLYGHRQIKNLATNRIVAAMQLQNSLHWIQPDSLVITPGDRGDIIAGMLQAHQSSSYPALAGLLLTAGLKPDPAIARLIEGIANPLPILSVKTDTYTTTAQVNEVHSALLPDDPEKITLSIETFDTYVDLERLEKQISTVRVRGMTPKMFTYNLLEQAKSNRQHIVLPEAYDPRILKAAAVLLSKGIVDITLLGNHHDIQQALQKHGLSLDLDQLTIINPATSDQLQDYANTFYELRKTKGVTPKMPWM